MPIICIMGPTASGKSDLALTMAQESGGFILNADRMQLYADLPTLSAHPSMEMKKTVCHEGYGILTPSQNYSAAAWVQMTLAYLNTERPCIIVGGTGFYFEALLEGLSPMPQISEGVQERITEIHCAGKVMEILTALVPDHGLHPHDTQRLCRALAVFWQTGIPLHQWQNHARERPLQHPVQKIILHPERPLLHARIEARVDAILEKGAIEEVQKLWAHYPDESAMIYKTLGALEILSFLKNEIIWKEMRERIICKTRQYAKRQSTWFKRYKTDE